MAELVRLQRLLSRCTSLSSLKQIHARLLLSASPINLHLLSASPINLHLHLLSRLLSLPFSSSALFYARSLLLLSSSPFPFNLLIRALASSSSPWHSPLQALRCFLLLLRSPNPTLSPDSYTFPFVFLACSHLPTLLPFAQSTHSLVLKCGFLRHHHTVHSLITMYSRCAQPASARQVFDQIPLRDLDLVSWNSIISGYVKMGFPNEAMRLFRQMLSQGWHPNDVTLLAVLAACGDLGDLETGQWLEGYLHTSKKCHIGSFVGSALIDMYAKCGFLEESRRVFDSVHKKDTFIWNSMITGF